MTGGTPELWGGVECTLNRVGEEFFDQLQRSGHAHRLADLDLFAGLGIRVMRYPVLWERTWPDANTAPDWTWSDERLARLRELGVRPVVGLVHHGSGPRCTHLLDPSWPVRLAAFARAAAERYPWVLDWTPVNEPLTTARFSALYGHWHPHARDARSFALALVHQCRGVALAMRAIRAVVPHARLVQTEDLGKTHATPRLAYQADFENERRWATFDLLCGHVRPDHAMWDFMRWAGVEERQLAEFAEEPCPPDVFGLNHYVTSERFLDERLDRYPADAHGGNEADRYVDVEAVRVLAEGVDGTEALLREAWNRYRAPLAVTEAHLGCSRDEQLRWLVEVWDAAVRLRSQGVDVRAVTAWSLLGTYDWSTLVTRAEGVYEPGAFDVRTGQPRPTALAAVIRSIAAGEPPGHPVLDVAGWWRRPARLVHTPVTASGRDPALATGSTPQHAPAAILLLDGGDVGTAVRERCDHRGLPVVSPPKGAAPAEVAGGIARLSRGRPPWAVVLVLDEATGESSTAFVDAAAQVAHAARARLVAFSSAAVFGAGDGMERKEHERPPDPPGDSALAESERRLRSAVPTALIVRLGFTFGGGGGDRLARALDELARRGEVFVPAEVPFTWSHLPDVADAALDLLVDGESGIWHLAAQPPATPHEVVRTAAALVGLDPAGVRERPRWAGHSDGWCPAASPLGSLHGALVPTLDRSLAAWAAGRSSAFPPYREAGSR